MSAYDKEEIAVLPGPTFEAENMGMPNETKVRETLQAEQAVISDELQPDLAIQSDPPDGGYGWVQVLVAHLEFFNTFGYINSYGLFENYYKESLGLSLSSISWAGSLQTFLLLSIGAISGRMYDAGYFHSLLIAGSIFQLVGVFMTSLATEYWQLLLAQGVCGGIGAGLAYCPVLANVSTYFSKNRTLAIVVTTVGSSTGGIVFPVIAQQMLPSAGFPWTVRCMGFVMLFNVVVILSFSRSRLPPRKSGPLLELSAFKELPYTLYTIGTFLLLWTVYICYNYINHFASSVINVNTGTSLTMLLILNGIGIPGRILPSFISTAWLGPLYTQAPITFISGILYFSWIAVRSRGGLYVFASFAGFINGGAQGIGLAGLPSLTEDLSKMGTRSGMIMAVGSIATLTGPPITGALIQAGGGRYLYMQIWAGATMMVVSGLMIAARFSKTHPGWYKRRR